MRGSKIFPFVIGAEVNDRARAVVPIGVVLATDTRDAWQQAIRRWPDYALVKPACWGKVLPKVRLEALEADRQMG